MNRCFFLVFFYHLVSKIFFGWDHPVDFRASHFKLCDDGVMINCENICEKKGPIVLLFFDSSIKRDRFGLLIIPQTL